MQKAIENAAKCHEEDHQDLIAFDDVSGAELGPKMVQKAQRDEIEYVRSMNLYTKVNIPRCLAKTGKKPIAVRWIDMNKGDDENPDYRSRLVGKELNDGQMGGLFAGTPPLEALRFLVHEAATVRSGEAMGSKVIMVNDVAGAFFEAPAMRDICIVIPKEDLSEATSVTIKWAISV